MHQRLAWQRINELGRPMTLLERLEACTCSPDWLRANFGWHRGPYGCPVYDEDRRQRMEPSNEITSEELDQAMAPRRAASAATALIEASRRIAQVMKYGDTLRDSADRVERQDPLGQPYPVTLVLMSDHVVAFLRALADAEDMRVQDAAAFEVEVSRAMGARPVYGPRRRDVE